MKGSAWVPAGDRQSRRAFLGRLAGLSLSLAALPLAGCENLTSARPPAAGIRRIGYLDPGSPGARPGELDAFREELRDLGYVEGQTLAIEYRYAGSTAERLGDLARDLAGLKLEAIVAFGTQAIQAARAATETSPPPIIMASSSDPVGAQFVASLASPGGQITGLTSNAPQLTGKRLQLLQEAFPHVSRVGYFWDSQNSGDQAERVQVGAAAERLGVQLIPLDLEGTRQNFRAVFAKAVNERAEAVITFASGIINNNPEPIVSFAAEHALPAMYAQREFVTEQRGLLAYGPSYPDMYRRAAVYVDKILKGAEPSLLPVEKPSRFKLVVSRQAVQALQWVIPRSLLVQVDEVV